MAQAPTLRPGADRPAPADVGYLLGSSRGQDVWASCERSILVVGPPGSGKGLHIAINAILDAPGAVITTSTKPDNIKATLVARSRTGPVGVFDPQGMLGAGFAHQVAWDAVAGCEDPIRAATRAEALAANTGITTSGENASGAATPRRSSNASCTPPPSTARTSRPRTGGCSPPMPWTCPCASSKPTPTPA